MTAPRAMNAVATNAPPVSAAKAVHAIMPPRAAANTSRIRRSVDPTSDDDDDDDASSIIRRCSRNASDVVDVDGEIFVFIDDDDEENIDEDDVVATMAFVPPET
jgi:hypothetical protein